ncbi:oligosaccharide flippase family protein [Staphylococcus equorum]
MKKSWKVNVLFNILTTILTTLLQIIIIILLSKYVGTNSVGLLTLGLAITAPILLLSRFNLRAAYSSDFNNEFDFNKYHTLRIISTIGYMGLSCLIIQFFNLNIAENIFLLLIILWKALETISDIIYAHFQKAQNMITIFYISLWKTIISIIVFIVSIYFFNNVIIPFITIIIIHFVFLILEYKKLIENIDVKLSMDFNIKNILVLTLPLGIAHFLTSMNVNVPRYILQFMGNTRELGVYGSLFYLITAGSYIILSINNAVLPRQAKIRYEKGFNELLKIKRKLDSIILLLMIPVIIICIFFGDIIIKLIFNDYIANYKMEFVIITFIALIKYLNINLENIYLTYHMYNLQLKFNIIYLILVTISSLVLVYYESILGATLSVLITELIMYVLKYLYLKRKVGE